MKTIEPKRYIQIVRGANDVQSVIYDETIVEVAGERYVQREYVAIAKLE